MSAPDLAAAYVRITDLYRRQLDLLAVDEPDFEAVTALIAGVDDELAHLPPSDRLPVLERDEAEQLVAAALEADALRAQAATRFEALRVALRREAALEERAASAVRAYGSAPAVEAARFLDLKR